eukprot:2834554-Pleurochrysis_carterae.AAC.1
MQRTMLAHMQEQMKSMQECMQAQLQAQMQLLLEAHQMKVHVPPPSANTAEASMPPPPHPCTTMSHHTPMPARSHSAMSGACT